jgi:hypothetical protein
MPIYLGNKEIGLASLGSLPVSNIQQFQSKLVEYLVVAGGGCGGSRQDNDIYPGGGGAGGLLSGSFTLQPFLTYQVQVGGGGIGSGFVGTNGASSYFTGSGIYVSATGGGAGGEFFTDPGNNGGSGGGGTYYFGASAGGLGTIGEGNNGASGSLNLGGGGGGAGAAASGGNGGNGKQSAINGTLTYYAGGGVGRNGTTAGLGGGGIQSTNGTNGLGGGGGGTVGIASNGGSGVVIIRYLGPQFGTGGTVTTDGSYIIHTFSATSTTQFTFVT